jgi:hypothetical protein
VAHSRTKHVDIKAHVVRERVETGEQEVIYKPSSEQLADAFTKNLGPIKFAHFKDGLGVKEYNIEGGC